MGLPQTYVEHVFSPAPKLLVCILHTMLLSQTQFSFVLSVHSKISLGARVN